MTIRDNEQAMAFRMLVPYLRCKEKQTSRDLEKLGEIRRHFLLTIRIRWIIVLLTGAYGFSAEILMRSLYPAATGCLQVVPLVCALLAVVLCNLFYFLWWRELSHLRCIHHLQIFLDIILLTVLIYYSGGIFSLLCYLYPVIALESAMLFDEKKDVWGTCVAACSAFGVLVVGHPGGFQLPFAQSSYLQAPVYGFLVWLWVVTLNAATTGIGFHVVSASREREAAMKYLAVKDRMTNLYNREYFFQELHNEIQRSLRYGRVFSVVFLDVDQFKEFNDTFGHLEGDRLLTELAGILRNNVRRSETDPSYDIDVPCRYGGEEFAVILPETPIIVPRESSMVQAGINAAAFAERIRRQVEALPANGFTITVSIGIASFPHHGRLADDLVRAADEALYTAKRCGKNRIVIAGESESPFQNGTGYQGNVKKHVK